MRRSPKGLAASMLEPLDTARRQRLVAAMGEVEHLLRAASLQIAPAAAGSVEARWCLSEYFRDLDARFDGGFVPPADESAELAGMTPPAGVFLLARLEGDPVGCGGLKRVDADTGEIKRLWTAPAARGLGIASRLVRALEDAAREMDMRSVRLDTNKALTQAQRLYRKEGYRETARFNDNPYAHHWFAKSL